MTNQMTKFIFAAALTLCAAVSAQAQYNPANRSPGVDTVHRALRDPDPIHRDERLIAGANRSINGIPGDSYNRRISHVPTFKAQVEVTNRSAKKIKAVSWLATLTDARTGEVIRTYDVTSKTNISPGKTKKLTKSFQTPHAKVVKASASSSRKLSRLADLKVAVTGVTYEDGSTATKP